MLIVDSQIHIWKNGKMSPHHRQDATYSYDDALAEMNSAGVDCAVIHPPGSLDWFWAACEKADLRLGLLVTGKTIPVFGKIAERHPGLKMHIDHIGRGGGRAAVKDDAAYADLGDMLALAKLPNVAVKLSGAPSTSTQPYPYKNIHRYLQQIVETFGPDRCFWGTDITRMPISYRQCVTMFTEEMPWLKGRDLERVMGGAIVDWLGWKRPQKDRD